MKQLRYCQKAAIDKVEQELQKGVSTQIIVFPTGAGKTFTASQIIKKFKKTLWITHVEELINQTFNVLSAELRDTNYFASIGIIKQERMEVNSDIVVASIQTLWRRLDQIDPNTFDLIILDECHLAGSKTWGKAFRHFNAKLKLGLTATPTRSDGFGLGNLFQKISYEYEILTAINDKYLCEIEAVRVQTDIDLNQVKTTGGELNQRDLRIIDIPERNNLIVDKYLEYTPGAQAIIYGIDSEHVLNIHRAFRNRGVSSSFVLSDKNLCPNREERIEAFKRGEITVMVNCMILTTGFDHPNVGLIGMACPTKSLTKFMQCVGRGMRLKTDDFVTKYGQKMILLDIVDAAGRHSLVNSWTLDDKRPAKEKVFMTKEQRDEAIIKEDRQKARIEDEKSLQKHDKILKMFKVPPSKRINTPKWNDVATEKQLGFLAGLGYDTKEVEFTKGMATDSIGSTPASLKQINFLQWKGYPVGRDCTKDQASICFDDYNEKNGIKKEWSQKPTIEYLQNKLTD